MQPAPPPRYLDILEAPPPAAAPAEPFAAWAQLGAWRTRRKAERMVARVRALAPDDPPPPVRVMPAQRRGVVWWRIISGPLGERQAADLCARLREAQAAPCWIRREGS